MALSERHGLDDIYREASRHVLDNIAAWDPEELAILSSETLLKVRLARSHTQRGADVRLVHSSNVDARGSWNVF